LHQDLAALGYPGFAHVRADRKRNPSQVLLDAVVQPNLDMRLVEALPWVASTYTDLDWNWLRDRAKLRNAQNRLGYVVHLAREAARAGGNDRVVRVLSEWERELEDARLAREDTLCRDSMSEREREWVRLRRPEAARHWNLVTGLTPEQLRYVAQ
jgi:hypothetical protein